MLRPTQLLVSQDIKLKQLWVNQNKLKLRKQDYKVPKWYRHHEFNLSNQNYKIWMNCQMNKL
jgi:hypothetical protein